MRLSKARKNKSSERYVRIVKQNIANWIMKDFAKKLTVYCSLASMMQFVSLLVITKTVLRLWLRLKVRRLNSLRTKMVISLNIKIKVKVI